MKKTFGIIGNPLSHSFSEKYFKAKFETEKIIDCEFRKFSITNISEFTELIQNNPSLKGVSVTLPYKQSIIPYLDELDDTAKNVKAVNCIKIDSRIIGYNTDEYGFRQSIKPFLEAHHERALILGIGGASKAVAYVLKEIGIECFFVSRTQSGPNTFSYSELTENIFKTFKLIVNATPVGMFPKTMNAPSIPYKYLTPSHFLYDLVYNPEETEFLKLGKQYGASGINGLSMLYLQAEKAWEIWNT